MLKSAHALPGPQPKNRAQRALAEDKIRQQLEMAQEFASVLAPERQSNDPHYANSTAVTPFRPIAPLTALRQATRTDWADKNIWKAAHMATGAATKWRMPRWGGGYYRRLPAWAPALAGTAQFAMPYIQPVARAFEDKIDAAGDWAASKALQLFQQHPTRRQWGTRPIPIPGPPPTAGAGLAPLNERVALGKWKTNPLAKGQYRDNVITRRDGSTGTMRQFRKTPTSILAPFIDAAEGILY